MRRMVLAINLLSLTLLLIPGTGAHAADVYVQNFNGDWPFDGWTDYNPDHGGKFEWESLKSMTCEGDGAIAHTNEDWAANAWVASPAITLNAGANYNCLFQQRVGNANFPEKMGTYIWKGNPIDFGPEKSSAILIWQDDDATNTTCDQQAKAFTVSTTGADYHVIFHCTSNADEYLAIWDDLILRSISAPTVTTAGISHITAATAQGGGNVSSDGGAAVTVRGVCVSKNPNPTTADDHTSDGSGTGTFTSSLTGLTPGETYHVRAYATNAYGTAYGDDLSFTMLSLPPTVSTTPPSHITATTAQGGGNVSSDGGAAVTVRGVCVSKNPNPTTADDHTSDGSGTGTFTSSLTGLTPGETYHVRAYATNKNGTAYGMELTFTEGSLPPTVSTASVTNITSTTARGGGSVSDDGGTTVTQRGVCWSRNANPTTADDHTSDGSGTGIFASNINGLTPGASYHVRAYATNSNGTAYGMDLTFDSGSSKPTVSTAPATHITSTTAQGGGNVSSDGGATVTVRGVCVSKNPNPTTADDHTSDGSGTGAFTSSLTGLTPGETYHVRAYATNGNGTAYGMDLTFTEGSVIPTVSTAKATNITATTAESGGNVTDEGGASVTQRGVCWSRNANPTTADDHTSDGSGSGSFASNINGLTPGETYHVRAYATNGNGTAYGKDLTFQSSAVAPTVSTIPATHITSTTAEGGGDVSRDGGATVTVRGVCWSQDQNPSTNDSHTSDGTGTGLFNSDLTGLTPGASYHVRAYATNNHGTAYGKDLSFKEGALVPTVTTVTPCHLTDTTAQSGGDVVHDGGATVTARGVCWRESPNPTVADDHTSDGDGTGSFTSELSGLSPGTEYHIRAYATNGTGTGYGDDVSFTTTDPAPTINGFSPSAGTQGTTVVITGRSFNGTTAVRLGGTNARDFVVSSQENPHRTEGESVRADSHNRITAHVGNGSTGYITVITARGTATSAVKFTYSSTPIPTLNRWGLIGLLLLLTGMGYAAIRKKGTI